MVSIFKAQFFQSKAHSCRNRKSAVGDDAIHHGEQGRHTLSTGTRHAQAYDLHWYYPLAISAVDV